MHGDGTRTATTISKPAARLFELTRSMRMYANRPTGVDRVCLAYLEAVIAAPEPCFGLVRTRFGYVLLDKEGMRDIHERLRRKAPWNRPHILHRLFIDKLDWEQPAWEAEVRRRCIARCTGKFLARMLRRHLPDDSVYVNVDQANFFDDQLAAIRSVPGMRVSLFIHDAIPLDFPEFQTERTHVVFKAMLETARVNADVILTNSEVSKDAIIRHMAPQGGVPEITVAHLGVARDYFYIVNNTPPPDIPKPYFVFLGTIEPRKNLGLLLDLWDSMAKSLPKEELPHLVLCGRRGWMVDDLIARIEASPLRGRFVHEFNDLEDDQIFAVVRGARAMLFPSLVEGYGLPPVEAAMLGTSVICNDLPVLREILHNYPIYAPVTDSYSWEKAILSLAKTQPALDGPDGQTKSRYSPPTWEAHFNTVLRVT